jgi:hypothetical protein
MYYYKVGIVFLTSYIVVLPILNLISLNYPSCDPNLEVKKKIIVDNTLLRRRFVTKWYQSPRFLQLGTSNILNLKDYKP